MSQIQIIKVVTPGPAGPQGPTGPQGPPGTTGPGIQLGTNVIGSDFTFQSTDFARYVDANAGAVTGTLPLATGSGQIYLAVKIDDTANPVTIATQGSDLIDGSSSINLVDQYTDCLLQDFAMGFWHSILAI